MANICITSLFIEREEAFESDEPIETLRKDIDESITYDGPTGFECVDEHHIECQVGTRWNVPTEALQAVALKHRVSIRAVGREDGCGFAQVVCVNDSGVVVQDAEIDYAF